MNLAWFHNYESSLENFDTDLQIFYHDIVSKELDLSTSYSFNRLRNALRDVVNAYTKKTVNSNTSKILFDSPEKRCAYVLKHCPCFTSAVAKHFLRLLRRNFGLLNQALYHRRINLCCLGGGPGTEIVAIAKILDLVKNSVSLGSNEKIHLSVTEVDLSEEWKITTELVLKTVQGITSFFDPDKVVISFKLIKADLTEPLEEEVKRALREADIITMVYFVSAVNGSKVQNRCVPMLQNIIQQIKPGAILFFLDSAKELHYDSMMDSLNKFPNLRFIYGPLVQKFHTLSVKSIRKFIELYFNQFNALLCLTNCFITCASWTKEICYYRVFPYAYFVAVEGPILSSGRFRTKGTRKWNKMVEQNTRKQERFRQSVEKLVMSETKMNFETEDWEENDYNLEMELYSCRKKILCAGKEKQKRIVFLFDYSIN